MMQGMISTNVTWTSITVPQIGINATNGKGWDWLFEYDTKDKNLYIPQIVYIEEVILIISDRYRVCHFNGKEFVDKGESAHRGLHKSLINYYGLACYFRNKNYFARVNQMDEKGNLRYVSWNSTLDISRQPDIVMQGVIYDEEENTYTFANDGYEYVVGYSEDKPTSEGMYEYHEYLMVKNGKIVLKEERERLNNE